MAYFSAIFNPLSSLSPLAETLRNTRKEEQEGLTYLREIVYDWHKRDATCSRFAPRFVTNKDEVCWRMACVKVWVRENGNSQIYRIERKITGITLSKNENYQSKLKRSVVHPLHRRPRGDPEEFTGSYVANGGGGRAAMLGPPRDRLPYSPDCALYPLSYPSVSCNAGTSDTSSSRCTPPAIENGSYFGC